MDSPGRIYQVSRPTPPGGNPRISRAFMREAIKSASLGEFLGRVVYVDMEEGAMSCRRSE